MKSHTDKNLSSLTAILPQQYANTVIESLIEAPGTSALVWNARGTLLQDVWYKQMLPTISPGKVMLQMLIPSAQLDAALAIVIEKGKLHLQGAGAVFASPCEDFWAGSGFHDWPVNALPDLSSADHPCLLDLKRDLCLIHCVVESDQTRAVSKAAIDAGAHGPVVFYGEGRGLRDHLGWLRITKQNGKEILTVLVEEAASKDVFSAMASAADIHLPGRGYMFMLPQERGMFNLPSRAGAKIYDANMQQVINAIDTLSGHTHWRDQSIYNSSENSRSQSMRAKKSRQSYRENKSSICAVVDRDYVDQLIEMMLEAGATGMQINYARFAANETGCEFAGAKINKEYAMLRAVRAESEAAEISATVRRLAEEADLCDLCLFQQPVPLVASYMPGHRNFRQEALLDSVASQLQGVAGDTVTAAKTASSS